MPYNLSLSKKRREIVVNFLENVNGKYIPRGKVDEFIVSDNRSVEAEFIKTVERLSPFGSEIVYNDLRTAAFVS